MYNRHLNQRGMFYTGGIKFTSDISDPQYANGRRCEYRDSDCMPLDTWRRWEWETRIPLDWVSDNKWCVIAQAHDSASNGKPPTFAVEIHEKDLRIKIRADDVNLTAYREPFIAGQWLKFEVTVCWSTENSGFLRFKMNGKEIVSYRGPTYYSGRNKGPYFLCGLYMSDESTVELQTIEHRV